MGWSLPERIFSVNNAAAQAPMGDADSHNMDELN